MPSEPIEQAIKGLLTEAAVATAKLDWAKVTSLADAALKLDSENADALKFKSLAADGNAKVSSEKTIEQEIQEARKARSWENRGKSDDLSSKNRSADELVNNSDDKRLLESVEREVQLVRRSSPNEKSSSIAKTRNLLPPKKLVRIFIAVAAIVIAVAIWNEKPRSNDALCMAAWAEAAKISDLRDTVEDLDPAVRACKSIEEWEAAAAKFPSVLDGTDPIYYLSNRCYYGPKSAVLCRWLVANPSFIDPDSILGF